VVVSKPLIPWLDGVPITVPSGSLPSIAWRAAWKRPLAGNTVATDRSFLARDMPGLESFLHYRIVDVSSIKELARRWYPRTYFNAPPKTGNHRALADIQESIEELRFYRAAVFVPPPGPDAETARTLAIEYGGSLTGSGAQGTPAAADPGQGNG